MHRIFGCVSGYAFRFFSKITFVGVGEGGIELLKWVGEKKKKNCAPL